MARILITGALGFAGRTLINLLSSDTDEIYAAYLSSEEPAADDPVRRHCRLIEMDILRPTQVAAAIEDIRPEQLYHLAALVPINVSLSAPARTMDVNVIGTVNLLEAVRASSCRPRILMPGSSEEFGLIHPHETPVTEEQPLRPTNPYGVSKATQTLLGMQYARTYGLAVIGGRAYGMREVLDKLLVLSSVDNIEVREDPSKHRLADNLLVLGSNRKLVEATGYQPRYSLDQTLADVLNDFRTRLAVESGRPLRTAVITESS